MLRVIDADCRGNFRIFKSMVFFCIVRGWGFGMLCCGSELQKSQRRLTEKNIAGANTKNF